MLNLLAKTAALAQYPLSVASLQCAKDVGSKMNEPSLKYMMSETKQNECACTKILTDDVEESEGDWEETPHDPKFHGRSTGGHGNNDHHDQKPRDDFLLESLVD